MCWTRRTLSPVWAALPRASPGTRNARVSTTIVTRSQGLVLSMSFSLWTSAGSQVHWLASEPGSVIENGLSRWSGSSGLRLDRHFVAGIAALSLVEAEVGVSHLPADIGKRTRATG